MDEFQKTTKETSPQHPPRALETITSYSYPKETIQNIGILLTWLRIPLISQECLDLPKHINLASRKSGNKGTNPGTLEFGL